MVTSQVPQVLNDMLYCVQWVGVTRVTIAMVCNMRS